MADWTDGAEYAPTDRPEGFAAPRAAALPGGPPETSPAQGLPVHQPDVFQAPPAGPPLDSLVPDLGPTRDARTAFGTQSTAMTTSAWGSAHSSTSTQNQVPDPSAPILTTAQLTSTTTLAAGPAPQFCPGDQMPVSGGAPGYPAPLDQPAQQPPVSARLVDVLGTLGWPILIVLVVGCLVQPLSWPLLVCALALASFHKNVVLGRRIRVVTAIAAIASVLLGFLLNVRDDVIWQMATYAQIGCVISLAVAAMMAATSTTTPPPSGQPGSAPPAPWPPR